MGRFAPRAEGGLKSLRILLAAGDGMAAKPARPRNRGIGVAFAG